MNTTRYMGMGLIRVRNIGISSIIAVKPYTVLTRQARESSVHLLAVFVFLMPACGGYCHLKKTLEN